MKPSHAVAEPMRPAQPRRAAALLLAVCGAVLLTAVAAAASETLFVTVKSASIRKDRQFYAPAVAAALFRDRLSVLGREKDWVRVRFKGVEGWVHVSATAASTVSVSAKEAAGGVSQDDVAFATKGFDASIEGEYRKGKPQANFTDVDRMEQLSLNEKALSEFRQAGNLRPRGGRP